MTDLLRSALEYYACEGLGVCSVERLPNGACIRAVTSGDCGHIAHVALHGGDPDVACNEANGGN